MKNRLFFCLAAAVFLFVASAGPVQCRERYVIDGTGIIPGMVSAFVGEYFAVLGIFAGSSARNSALRVGDKLVSINGQDAASYRGTDGLFKALNPPAGQSVQIRVERLPDIVDDESRFFDVTLASRPIPVSSSTVPNMGMPRARVGDPVSSHACSTTLAERDPVRQGDHFFVFDMGDCLGTGRIYLEGDKYKIMSWDIRETFDIKSMNGKNLVFFRPGDQSTLVRNSAREWPMRIPTPRPHPLFEKYNNRADLGKFSGEVLTHDRAKKTILLKVVAGSSSAPMGGAPGPGGGMYHRTTIRFNMVTVNYGPETEGIPSRSWDRINSGDHIGVFYPKEEGRDIVRAALIHIFRKN